MFIMSVLVYSSGSVISINVMDHLFNHQFGL